MVFPLSFAFLPNPMRMRDTDRMQNPVEYQKRENRHDEDQRHQLVIGFRIRVCLRQNVDDGVSNQSPTGQAEQELDQRLEELDIAAFFSDNKDQGSEESDCRDTNSSQNAKPPNLCDSKLWKFGSIRFLGCGRLQKCE